MTDEGREQVTDTLTCVSSCYSLLARRRVRCYLELLNVDLNGIGCLRVTACSVAKEVVPSLFLFAREHDFDLEDPVLFMVVVQDAKLDQTSCSVSIEGEIDILIHDAVLILTGVRVVCIDGHLRALLELRFGTIDVETIWVGSLANCGTGALHQSEYAQGFHR